jgi:hypothetical protein
MFEWSLENGNTSLLPDPKELVELITTRNLENLYPNEDGTKEKAKDRLQILEQSHAWIDFYTDKMVPAVAGVKLWGPSICHLEPMSVSCFPKQPGKLRITASTKAFVLVLYKNGYKKWKAMIMWKKGKANKNKKFPLYNPKKPNLNKQFSTPYSSGNCGQQKFGGWNNNNSTIYRNYFGYSKTWPENTYRPEGTLPTP